ncbi:NPCBM/NEW2 domain-containing protein [Labedaea rhizosphaerae]|uniref:Alpha-galactosidase n=1 Tax=Labedaea rhizosphaerae TaxID=598644 RepID=A0A4R6SGT5_LABRH|nr:NPCBM/NEW2 domain-containing protein [Labedaea rhizosphaerae]TDQ00730.1 alpha-galactosidase [Labedaea rhizosphaerae]
MLRTRTGRRAPWLALLVGGLLALAFVVAPTTATAQPTAPSTATPAATAHHDPHNVAATPPMGWNDWYTFFCNVDENLVKQTADAMVSSGMRDAGYDYVNLDDCWAGARDADGNMTADPKKFPHGIKALADYVHGKGLKLGVYTDVGTKTCAGYAAGYNNEARDVNTFASWGVDFVKVDWCAVPYNDFPGMSKQDVAKTLYSRWAKAFDEAPRAMLFSMCVWEEAVESWEFAPELAQMWRTSTDYSDNWDSFLRNGDQVARLHDLAGPGGWNDPDILMVGHGELDDTSYQSQFSMWSMAAAPLLAGNDLRSMSAATREILTNKEVIAIDQDKLGKAGYKVRATPDEDVWARPLSNGDTAVLLVNRTDRDRLVQTNATELGLPKSSAYGTRDLWQHKTFESAGTFSGYLPPHGSRMLRISGKTAGVGTAVSWGAAATGTVPGLDVVVAAPGEPVTLQGTAVNDGVLPVPGATASLTAPAGWTATPAGPRTLPLLKGAGGQATAQWKVEPSADIAPGTYDLKTTLKFQELGQPRVVTYATKVLVPAAPPAGSVALSDLNWLSMANGYGPALKDKNYYGNELSIGGQLYPKGLWTHPAGQIDYFLGGHCGSFSADLGIDDSQGNKGSVVFSVYTNGELAYQSPVLHGADPVEHMTVDVSGAQSLRIAVADAGDGVTSDNADWGAPTLTCS